MSPYRSVPTEKRGTRRQAPEASSFWKWLAELFGRHQSKTYRVTRK